MKKLSLLVTAFLLLCSTTTFAETVVIDGITYDVVAKAKVATVIESETGYSGDIVIPETVEYNDITYSVTSIGNYAFSGCYRLTRVVIPNSVTSIGNSAFSGCDGLTRVEIPNSVTSIGAFAFSGCYGLTSVVIPNSVTSIGNDAFNGCSGLTSIEIPNSVTSIGYEAFYNCSKLTSVEIPNSVTSIGNYAFYNCSGLTSVTIGRGIESISSNAFAKCSDLTDVYCLATTVPRTSTEAFNESYPEYMTLHVPAEAINYYKTTEPWSSFGTIVTLDSTETERKVCSEPIISYKDGELIIDCETEGAEFITEITSSDINKFYNNRINITATYSISVYAMAAGHENSKTVNATLCWIENSENNGENGNTTNVIDVPATTVLITSANGTITVNCNIENESIEVYTTDGTLITNGCIENGSANIYTGLSTGSVAIVKIAQKSIKIIVD